MASLLAAANWPVIGQICWVLGKVMEFIYNCWDRILPTDAGLVGLSIITYTLVVYTIMLPLTINQQRSTRMTAAMNPELQAIQKKYKNKKDQASQMAQQEEMQQVYDKYGVSMWGGCLPMLIQLPLLFALYPVIYSIADYVPEIAMAPDPAAVNRFLTIPDMSISPWTMIRNSGNYTLPAAVIVITAIALPVLSGVTQYLSVKLSQSTSASAGSESMGGSMQMMNIVMPLFSVYIVFTLPAGIGLYWICSAIFRSIQQVLINRHLNKTSLEELVDQNREKAEQKKQKRGERADKMNAMAQTNTRSIKTIATQDVSDKDDKADDNKSERSEKLEKAQKHADNAKEGSLASKANMVKRYNENK